MLGHILKTDRSLRVYTLRSVATRVKCIEENIEENSTTFIMVPMCF